MSSAVVAKSLTVASFGLHRQCCLRRFAVLDTFLSLHFHKIKVATNTVRYSAITYSYVSDQLSIFLSPARLMTKNFCKIEPFCRWIFHPLESLTSIAVCGSYFLELLRCPQNPITSDNIRNSSLPTGCRILTALGINACLTATPSFSQSSTPVIVF
jgi:hypothetical protein